MRDGGDALKAAAEGREQTRASSADPTQLESPHSKKKSHPLFFEEHALLEASGFREPSKEVAREVSKEEPTTWRPGLTGSGSLSLSDFGKMIVEGT